MEHFIPYTFSFWDFMEADKIRFHFKGDLAGDYILKLQYVEADKEAYYAEQAKTVRENLIKTAARVTSGTAVHLLLHNIFQSTGGEVSTRSFISDNLFLQPLRISAINVRLPEKDEVV